ncbi:MAG: CoA-binding protein, partial [Pseudomonadales bacterium]
MTIRNLEKLFDARSVAIIGASESAGSIGSVISQNVLQGGFTGELWAVNPRYTEVHGIPCFADIAALPAAPDLALIAT